MNRECPICHKEFKVTIWNKKYCSNECVVLAEKPYRDDYRLHYNLSHGTAGALAELIVATDLIKRGFELYRAMSQSSSCDLLALKNKKLYDFEVRTGYRNKKGSYFYSKHSIKGAYLAIVIHKTNEIIYEPKI